MKTAPNGNGVAAGLSGFVPPVFAAKRGKVSAMPADPPHAGGSLRYPSGPKRAPMLWLAFAISASLHGAFFMMGNIKFAPKPVIEETETVEVAFFVPPKLKEEDLVGDEIVESEGESGEALAGVDVPMIQDSPATVNLGDFVQAFDMTSLLPRADVEGAKNLTQIPVNFRRGGKGGTATSVANIFNLADLDRAPVATFQPAPVVPHHLIREAAGAHVTVEFVVSRSGEVVSPRVVSSDNSAFDDLAVKTVKQWKFRPGFRRGKTVNTRMLQPIRFKIGEE
jgi:TonB family protein